ncbi:MAG: cytochrome-c peroxidase [Beijerinckiaceae bacterium]
MRERKDGAASSKHLQLAVRALSLSCAALAAVLALHSAGLRPGIAETSSGADITRAAWNVDGWDAEELAKIASLSIGALPKLPPDPTNKYADDERAAEFGHRLFFDTALSSNGQVACATCHSPVRNFTDGRKLSVGVGITNRNAPTIVGTAYNTWFFWDGRKDSQWSQALASLENPKEHNMPRAKVVGVLRASADYRKRYTEIFGPLPAEGDKAGIDRAFANVGKAIAAYERKILPGPTKFDRYAQAMIERRKPGAKDLLTLDESLGLKTFITDVRGRCMHCHNGPLLTNGSFHNIGIRRNEPARDAQGRAKGVTAVLKDEFNCLSRFSDARPDQCQALKFVRTDGADLAGAFKTPSLRYLGKAGPYMHNGSQRSLEDVTWHYRTTPIADVGKSELEPFVITDTEFVQIERFLLTLDGKIAADPKWLQAPGSNH